MLKRPSQAVPGQSGRWSAEHLDTVDRDRAGARAVVPADAVEQGGLSCAVRADEAEDLACLHSEPDVGEDRDPTEAEVDVGEP
jgi:hypothetical protein